MSLLIDYHTGDGSVLPTEDMDHFHNTLQRARKWNRNGNRVTVHIHKREASGWLEYGIDIKNNLGNQIIFIGAIQRQVGADSEFHS